jgi:hypothetical protein
VLAAEAGRKKMSEDESEAELISLTLSTVMTVAFQLRSTRAKVWMRTVKGDAKAPSSEVTLKL